MAVIGACLAGLLAAGALLPLQTERGPRRPAASGREEQSVQPGGDRASSPVEESFLVSGEHPLLFLRPQRIRLLRRERERHSARWQQFEALMAGHAAMPEQGFALALYYQVAGDAGTGRRAIEWALTSGGDLRQLALVFDWCQPLLSEPQAAALAAKLERALRQRPRALTVSEARSRALAATVLAGRLPAVSQRELESLVQKWWRGEIVPAVKNGRNALPRSETYALFEMLHAVRDNLNIDLRESLPAFFMQLPLCHLLSYYPASYPSAENEFRIPAVKGAEPDLAMAAMSRVADLAMVAYDNNAIENQYLQGWAMHDRFLLRGPLGIPYEFLWANPYQPGLSYYNLPLAVHDQILGRVFLRSRWDDDAVWLGYFDGQLQTFSDGEPKILPLGGAAEPMQFGDTVVVAASRFVIKQEATAVYVVGLAPSQTYDIEPDAEELHEARTDPGGILELKFPSGFSGGIRLRRLAPQ
jgi:hypothetical protein